MTKPNFHQTSFLLSATTLRDLPADNGREVAMVGRSNVGKSSIINCVAGQQNLARRSKTPGRTQTMNVFLIDETKRLVDLPGYGYAKAPVAEKKSWQTFIKKYIDQRQSLCGLLWVMDIRHPLTSQDQAWFNLLLKTGLPLHVILNKEDQLTRSAANKHLHHVQQLFAPYSNFVTSQCFSAKNRVGLGELENLLNHWFTESLV